MFPDSAIAKKYRMSKRGIKETDRTIKDGSDKLNHDLKSQPLDQEKLQCDNQLIQMGLQRKNLEDLPNSMNKRAKLRKMKKKWMFNKLKYV